MALTKENKPINGTGIKHLWSKIVSLFAKKTDIDSLLTSKGQPNGLATLDSSGRVPSSQLPSYVDDVLEYDNKTAFPATGEAGKIYVSKNDNKTWRWSGSTYVEISASLTLGETSSTAYPGDKGKALAARVDNLESNYDDFTEFQNNISSNLNSHISNKSNPHGVTKSQVGLGNVNNTSDTDKPVSTAQQAALDTKLNKSQTNNTGTNETDKYDINFVNDTFTITLTNKVTAPIVGEGSKAFALSYSNGAKWNNKTLIDESMALTTAEINNICV